MKATCMLSLSFIFSAAVVAQADTSVVSIPNLTFVHRTNLIDIDQSQTFETLSMADEFSRLPVSAYKVARVHFLSSDGGTTFSVSDAPDFTDTTIDKCTGLGYTETSCSSGNPTNICPYNSSYFEECCDAKYKYSQCQHPYIPGDISCGGKYECVCDKDLFPIRASSCEAPMIATTEVGSSCVEGSEVYVSECVCPSNYTETCSKNHLQGKGVGCTKNGETKYTSCECESGYNLTCSDSDVLPKDTTDFCLKDGVKYYKECEAAYKGCPTGSVDLDKYWCEGALKCVIK